MQPGPGNEVLLQRVWFSVRLLVSHGLKRGCYVRAEGGEFTRSMVPFQNELPLFALSCHVLDKMNKPRTASSLLSFFFSLWAALDMKMKRLRWRWRRMLNCMVNSKVNYAKALRNYIKTVNLTTRKYFVVLPRQRLLYKQLLICWFILSLLF